MDWKEISCGDFIFVSYSDGLVEIEVKGPGIFIDNSHALTVEDREKIINFLLETL